MKYKCQDCGRITTLKPEEIGQYVLCGRGNETLGCGEVMDTDEVGGIIND